MSSAHYAVVDGRSTTAGLSGYDVPVAEVRNAKERLLGAAFRLMYTRGYNSVGIAEICRSADVNKGSFYYFFESKEALALEALDRSSAWTRSNINGPSLDDPTQGGLDAIDKYGNYLADGLAQRKTDGDKVPGCILGNFAVELSTQNENIRARVSARLDEMVDSASLAIVRSIELGEISPATDVDQAARAVIAHMEGLMVLAKARRDPDLLRELGPTIRRLLT
jgi:TetR/AcrR family transcriptional repressor of nem operon